MLTAQFRSADNMTDMMGALSLLNDVEGPERSNALDDFYRRFSHDPLVVEKWLALQAVSRLPNTLEVVRKLMDHKAFSLKNPNKVRSLLLAFAYNNPLRFHATDGSGYEFTADRVIELDPINSQIAARLLSPLGRWHRYDEDRQIKMKAALQRVLDTPTISSGVYEIATKSLG